MKINRLLEITVLLLNKKKITSKELAERFEVSTRTIYRDIEMLSMSGVPVYMSKGKGGGISIIEEYSVNKALLSNEDKEGLIVALKTLQATKYPEINLILEKIGSIFNNSETEDWVEIDFSNWGSNPNENHKFSKIKTSILKRIVINFDYVNAYADKANRSVEPMKLVYKGQAWYLHGYCKLKQDFRVFRISRIKNLIITNENFNRREIKNVETFGYKDFKENMVTLKLRFKAQALYRIFDDFDEEYINRNEDNTYDVTTSLVEDEWVYSYILSFGSYVEVLKPQYIKKIIVEKMKEAIKNYEK